MWTTRGLDRLERWEAVDGVGDPLADLVGRTLPPGRVKDLLSGTWLGHPLHPMLVGLPIGAFVGVSALDALHSFGREGGRDGAVARRQLLGVGLMGALPAVAAGSADWSDTSGAERRVGVTHGLLNTVALGLYTASWVRRRRHPANGKVLAAAGLGVLAAAGWLGGHLAYALGVGVDVTVFEGGPTEWTDVVGADDLVVGRPRAVDAGGVSVMVLERSDHEVAALANRCTHRGGPLAEGEVDGDCVSCPWHGSVFRLDDGAVVRGPATRPAPVYEARVRDGAVSVRRDEARSLRTNPV